MDIQDLAQGNYVHWGAYCSLYTGKTRAYLINKGIEHVEVNPSHPHYVETILPTLGFFSVPVLETPDGEIIQDSTEIIEFLEKRHAARPMLPEEKPLQALAWQIHNYGTDGLFKPAMHYRWNYKESNCDFLIDEFARGFAPPEQRGSPAARAQATKFADEMDGYLRLLGVTETTIPAVEQSTGDLFDRLNAHFLLYPYLLGGRPSIADCGMMTALFAHLGRDPYPSQWMKTRAPALHRWTETMNRAGVVDPELWNVAPEFFTSDSLPETLMAFLRLLCADFGPELKATAAAYHRWLDAVPDRPSGSVIALDGVKAIRQSLGEIEHQQQRITITRTAWVDTLLTHQRVIDIVDTMNDTERQVYEGILEQAEGDTILSIRLERPVTRNDYAAVLR